LKLRLQTKIKISSEKVGLKLSPPVKTKVKCYIRYDKLIKMVNFKLGNEM